MYWNLYPALQSKKYYAYNNLRHTLAYKMVCIYGWTYYDVVLEAKINGPILDLVVFMRIECLSKVFGLDIYFRAIKIWCAQTPKMSFTLKRHIFSNVFSFTHCLIDLNLANTLKPLMVVLSDSAFYIHLYKVPLIVNNFDCNSTAYC